MISTSVFKAALATGIDRDLRGLQSSSHNTALTRTPLDSVGVNASIGPWISRSYNQSLRRDDATTDWSVCSVS